MVRNSHMKLAKEGKLDQVPKELQAKVKARLDAQKGSQKPEVKKEVEPVKG